MDRFLNGGGFLDTGDFDRFLSGGGFIDTGDLDRFLNGGGFMDTGDLDLLSEGNRLALGIYDLPDLTEELSSLIGG